MAYALTIKERTEMKRMGWTIRAWYKNANGVPFHKNFTTAAEYRRFTEQVKAYGGTETAHQSI